MKTFLSLLFGQVTYPLLSYAAPSTLNGADVQVVMNAPVSPRPNLDESLKAWVQDEREYVKQDNTICMGSFKLLDHG